MIVIISVFLISIHMRNISGTTNSFLITETGRMKEATGPQIKRIYLSPGMHPLYNKGVIVYKTIATNVDMRNLNDVSIKYKCG